jgi:hypothetical protein
MKQIFAHAAHRNLRNFLRSDVACCAPFSGMPESGHCIYARTI